MSRMQIQWKRKPEVDVPELNYRMVTNHAGNLALEIKRAESDVWTEILWFDHNTPLKLFLLDVSESEIADLLVVVDKGIEIIDLQGRSVKGGDRE